MLTDNGNYLCLTNENNELVNQFCKKFFHLFRKFFWNFLTEKLIFCRHDARTSFQKRVPLEFELDHQITGIFHHQRPENFYQENYLKQHFELPTEFNQAQHSQKFLHDAFRPSRCIFGPGC
jgi:hypothetical protein